MAELVRECVILAPTLELISAELHVSPLTQQVAIDEQGIVREVGDLRQILTDMIAAYQETMKDETVAVAARQTVLAVTLMVMPTTTTIPLALWPSVLLAVVLLGVSGCTTAEPGSSVPAGENESGQTASSPPTNSDDVAAKLAAIDPCTLLTQAELDQYGLRKQSSGNVAGARNCAWNRRPDTSGKGGFTVGPAIWDHQGLKDINTEGHIVTDVLTIGKHQARQAEQVDGNACFVAIGVTDSSRVDIVVAGDRDEQCGLADQFAKLIEPRLPGGG